MAMTNFNLGYPSTLSRVPTSAVSVPTALLVSRHIRAWVWTSWPRQEFQPMKWWIHSYCRIPFTQLCWFQCQSKLLLFDLLFCLNSPTQYNLCKNMKTNLPHLTHRFSVMLVSISLLKLNIIFTFFYFIIKFKIFFHQENCLL